MAAIENLLPILVILTTACFSFGAITFERTCQKSNVGLRVDFRCPCQTGVGSFSKSNEKGTIWSNGIVAKDKKGRISFENQSVIINRVVSEDQGEYVWVCDDTYWESTVCLVIEHDIEQLNHLNDRREQRPTIVRAALISLAICSGALIGLTICIAFIGRFRKRCHGKENTLQTCGADRGNISKNLIFVGNKSKPLSGYHHLKDEPDKSKHLTNVFSKTSNRETYPDVEDHAPIFSIV